MGTTAVQSKTERIQTIIDELDDLAKVVNEPVNPKKIERYKKLLRVYLKINNAVSALKEAATNLEEVECQEAANTPNLWADR